MLRNAGGSKLLALRGVTVGGAGVIFVKISVTYFLNSPILPINPFHNKQRPRIIVTQLSKEAAKHLSK